MYRPCGFRILIEMDEVEREVKGGSLDGFQLTSNKEHDREENGHCIGKIVAIGPTAFLGYAGCEQARHSEEAAGIWGCKLGDMVEFKRYDGKIPLQDEEKKFRLINDSDIMMVITNG